MRERDKIPCPVCGKQSPADGAFCIYCGSRLAPQSAALAEEAAIAQTAPAQVFAPQSEQAADKGKDKTSPALWQKALTYAGGACALFAALCAMIFVFCIGCAAEGSALSETFGIQGIDLYYYFGDVYRDLQDALDATFRPSDFYTATLYIQAICGTLVSAAAHLEAWADYPEEDIPELGADELRRVVEEEGTYLL